jgi:FG-GAP-like repeat/FG-GAP repeat
MKTALARLCLERLEARDNPASVLLPQNIVAGGYTWRIANNTSAIPGAGVGLGITDATKAGGALTDAYDGAFVFRINGTVFQDPTGTVDLTGTTLNSNVRTISGIDVQVQYFFVPSAPVVRALLTLKNTGGTAQTASVVWENDLGSDGATTRNATSDGDTTLELTDRWLVTDGQATDPTLTWVFSGPGQIAAHPSQFIRVPGELQAGSVDKLSTKYDLLIAAGGTRRLMFFGELSDNVASAITAAPTFDSNATVRAGGFLAGLTAQQLGQIANWNLGPDTVAVGTGPGTLPLVSAAITGNPTGLLLLAQAPNYRGGLSVAAGDVNGDGFADIIAGRAQGTPLVNVFSGATGTLIRSFLAYPGSDGVSVAAGDVNGDGLADIITGRTRGLAAVFIYDGASGGLLGAFAPFGAAGRRGGATVAAGDVNGDGRADVIVGGGVGFIPIAAAFNGTNPSPLAAFLAFDARLRVGVNVGAGDVNGDGRAEMFAIAGTTSLPLVRVFDAANPAAAATFLAFPIPLPGGIHVAGADVNGDGIEELISSGGQRFSLFARILDGRTGAVLSGTPGFELHFGGGLVLVL